ncbi:hypothetical protein CC86DRAFT_384695 [Ophiobolus disseminans]|uniref:DUF7587 domain-containing protein n=1 Tax=Ophiobolus disseminans TaxID=1469910 RepID=A0A6A6ZS91_9PLEO|nr:hypothetical protein CC86DRAFT_384695 [Ophiobolus disseminans]
MSRWEDAGFGVQLWMPALEHADATTKSLARLSVARNDEDYEDVSDYYEEHDLVLPSIEENLRVKQQIFGPSFLRVSICRPHQTDRHSLCLLRPSVDNFDDFDITPPTSSTEDTTCEDYDSDRTDFLATTQTPCPVTKASKEPPSVRRKLDFGTIPNKSVAGSSQKPIKMLCAPEYSPVHRWSDEERELLCVMWRWYARAPASFAQIFNTIFNLNLSMSKVRDQFENYLRLHGPQAFLVYREVLSVPFDDPDHVYDDVRGNIEATAQLLNIELHKLASEVSSPSGSARKAKSARTRKLYKSLVRRTARQEKAKANQLPMIEKAELRIQNFGGVAIDMDAESDMVETFSDSEEVSSLVVEPAEPSPPLTETEPQLGFRVWDDRSRAKYTEEIGFLSEAFSIWRGPSPPPFSPASAEGRQAISLLSNLHLSMNSGGASTWVSVSTSLLQALVKACSMERPRIAIIDLGHPSLQEPNKMLKTSEVLCNLKSDGQAWWARYKGHAERMIWASIPRAAIIHHISLGDIITLSDTHPAAADLLHLEEFQAGRRTMTVATQLRDKNITLSVTSAHTLGLICKQFGLHHDNVKLHHIQDMVGRLVDSWTIMNSMSTVTAIVARAFTGALDSRVHRSGDVVQAFVDGFQQGTATLKYYQRRRPTARRVRSA